MLSTFCENLIVDSVRVYPPRKYILLCGGEVSRIIDPQPISIRDAFLRGGGTGLIKNTAILQIEEIQDFFEKDSPYNDLVKFERDIAQLCELVLLFSEGPGSFAELGSFSMVEEISEKMMVVIQNRFLSKSSFITKGPVANLKREYPNSVFSISDTRLGIAGTNVAQMDANLLCELLTQPVQVRLQEAESRTRLNTTKFSHLCKAYVALLREFYALKDAEIITLLSYLGFEVDVEHLERIRFCCSAVRWTSSTLAGFDRVHYALPGNEAAKFEFQKPLADKVRRRTDIRQHWDQSDPDRVAVVDEGLNS